MTAYAVDSRRQDLRATGIVNPVREWRQDPATGKRRRTEVQEVNQDRIPMWDVEIRFVGTAFGEDQTMTAFVKVGSETRPEFVDGSRPEFMDLWVEERGTRTVWWADSLRAGTAEAKQTASVGAGAK